MLAQAFRHRSGRVIALSRLSLAAVFLLAILIVPREMTHEPHAVYALLGAYVVWSAAVLALTWSNWWIDFKLGVIAHAIDVGAFGVIVYYTEGYTSPFYTFFVFLILSAAIRWSRRETALTAVIVLLFFVTAGSTAILFEGAGWEGQRLVVRATYLIVLSLLLMWFGANQPRAPEAQLLVEEVPDAVTPAAPLDQILDLAQRRLAARRVLIAWWQREEPWLNVTERIDGEAETQRFNPDMFPLPIVADADEEPFLFDIANDRALYRSGQKDGLPRVFFHAINPSFAREFGLTEGLVVRVRAREYEGELFALDIAGMCADDLWNAALLGESIARLFDRSSMLAVSEEAAVARAKASLARDLHDSVVQVLAGTSFRLEALRSWIRAGHDANPEIDALKTELGNEQRKVREFIASLRSGRDTAPWVDLRAGMRKLAEELRQRWDIDCELIMSSLLPASPSIQHEVQQIIREAAANAKRHGGAKRLRLDMNASDEDLSIRIIDNGKGFPVAGDFDEQAISNMQIRPWSVHERVKRLGGTLALRTSSTGTELSIAIPIGPSTGSTLQ
jgi:signal transduction histidine kinase